MTTTTRNSPAAPIDAKGRARGPALAAGALGFALLYLSVDVVAANLASSASPLPNAPAAEARAWFGENQLAAVMTGVLQFLSVSCLALFVSQLRRTATSTRQRAAAGRAAPWGFGAAGLMMLASALAWLLASVAPIASVDTVSVLRTGNFIAGGTAHVVALGIFVLLASRIPGMTKPIRVLAYVAAVPSVLSLSSLVVFEGAAFILLGRLLCMLWIISAAVSVVRRLAKGTWA